MRSVSSPTIESGSGWQASQRLNYVFEGGRTRLRRGLNYGPLYVQKPFYPEGDVCHTYLLHPPGGVAGGDSLDLKVCVKKHAHALLTVPAATKFYRTSGAAAEQHQHFEIETGGVLEWLPMETLFFGGTRAVVTTDVLLHPGAVYIGWEICCLGRPASADHFGSGSVDLRTTIRSTDPSIDLAGPAATILRLNDRCHWQAGDPILQANWGLHGRSVCATLYAAPVDKDLLDQILRAFESCTDMSADLLHGISAVNGVMTARVLARDAESANTWLRQLWTFVRPRMARKPACAPRIWQT
ncbi:MAG: urease accessory protein UreD [Proteobacteria bacterium]|nr:urease accessory protein UreD [Pseudomonadota bacterium]